MAGSKAVSLTVLCISPAASIAFSSRTIVAINALIIASAMTFVEFTAALILVQGYKDGPSGKVHPISLIILPAEKL